MRRPRLPDGYRVRLRGDVTRLDQDRLLVGGSPLRALRLSEKAREVLGGAGFAGDLVVRDATSAILAGRLLDGNFADPVLDDRDVAAGEMTVVIPVRDRAGQLDRTLASLTGLHCLVVDDASEDPTAVAAVAAVHGADVVALPVNVGPAGARNAGLERVRTPYVAFVDSDVAVTTRTLLSVCRHFADPAVALAAPRVRSRSLASEGPSSRPPRWFERYDEWSSSLDLGQVAASVGPRAAVAWLPSACLVGRTEALREVGGFDSTLRVGEDVDLVWRLVGAGSVVRYDPSREAAHDTRSSLRGWLGRKFVYGSGGATLGRRHGTVVAPAELSPAMAVAAGALLLRRPWGVPVALAGTLWTNRTLSRALPRVPGVRLLSLELSTRGLGWAVRQEASLLLRDWWPATLLGSVASPRARRAVASALVVDSIVALATRRHPPGLVVALAGRRLDDAAYGAGLWVGAVRGRSVTALLPRAPR